MSASPTDPSRPRAIPVWWCALALLLGLALHTPSLGWGYFADDYGAQLVIEGRIESPTWKPWSLYDFGSYAQAPALTLERGGFPWWIDPDWSVRFLRPLSSLSLWLDHALFGRNPFAGHAVNLGLFALLLLSARRLYERLGLSPAAALLAMMIVAFDNGALVPVSWLSNRNSLLEGLFTVLALLAGLRATQRASPWRVASALLLAAAALASKESGLCAFAALALLFLAARARAAVAVCGIAVLGYLAVYVALGYGSNVNFYPTPWGDPLEFGARTLQLLVCAPLAAATPFPMDALAHLPQYKVYFLSAAVLLGAPLLYVIVRKLRGQPQVKFLALWGLFALLPQAGAPISDRLMFTPMLAWAPLLAMFLVGSWTSSAPRAGERRDAWIVAASTLLLSPLALFGAGQALGRAAELLRTAITRADVGDDSLGARHAFLLQASPSSLLALAPLSTWVFEGGSEDVRFYPLQGGQRALRWTRLGESSFALESLDEPFLTHPMEQVFLTRAPKRSGAQTWRTGALLVRGAPEAGGELRRIEVEVGLSLDDPRCRFLFFDGETLVHRAPPGFGESVELPRGVRDPFLP